MIKKIFLYILLIVAFGTINAQTTSGVVKVRKAGGEVEPLAYASVYWLEGKVSAETNERGEFTLNTKGSAEISIVAAFPFIFIMLLTMVSILKALKEEPGYN